MATNVFNDTLHDGGGLSTGVMENVNMDEAQDTADADVPVAPVFFNDFIPAGGFLSMGLVVNT